MGFEPPGPLFPQLDIHAATITVGGFDGPRQSYYRTPWKVAPPFQDFDVWGVPGPCHGCGRVATDAGIRCNAGLFGLFRRPESLEQPRMAIRIKARGGESAEQMLRRFKKLCEKEGLTKDVKKRQYYEKPSERNRREQRKREARVIRGGMPAR